MEGLGVLKKDVGEAYDVLRICFRVTPEEGTRLVTPCVAFGERSNYDADNNIIVVQPEYLGNKQVIGEEVSHYFHCQLNPSVWRVENPFDVHGREYVVECVGHYGAIVYLGACGVDYKNADFSGTPPIEEGIGWDNLVHEKGYERAKALFELYGDSKLPELTRMGFEEAYHTLPRIAPIGWWERRIIPVTDRLFARRL